MLLTILLTMKTQNVNNQYIKKQYKLKIYIFFLIVRLLS
jgi:hypothetical protein